MSIGKDRPLVFILATGAGMLVLGAVATWVGDARFAAVATGMVAGLLLGLLLLQRPGGRRTGASGAMVLAGLAGGALLAGSAPMPALAARGDVVIVRAGAGRTSPDWCRTRRGKWTLPGVHGRFNVSPTRWRLA